VIAVVMAGLLIGNYGTRMSMSASSRVSLLDFWEVLAFLVNSGLFLLIGLEFDIAQLRGRTLAATASVVVAMLVGRAVVAYVLLGPFRHARAAPVHRSWPTAVFWGGLRGSIPIALVLGLPQRTFDGIDAVGVVFGVVLFSLIVQGLTYRPLLDRLGLTASSDEITRYEALLAQTVALRSARRELQSMRSTGEIVPTLYDDLLDDIDRNLDGAERELAQLTSDAAVVRDRQVMLAARRLAAAQKRALSDATRSGRIGEHVARSQSREIDATFAAGEHAREHGGVVDPTLFPERDDDD
jgi:CPA1 family monovalent cation:H+ antiporter